MKQRLIAVILALVILLASLSIVIPSGGIAHAMTGTGTITDPYIIRDITDFQNINNDLAAYYELGNDINASATTGWNWDGGHYFFEGFQMLGGGPGWIDFNGSLNGNGYIIDGLYQRIEYNVNAIFFSVGSTGIIKNIGFTNATIISQDSAGGIFEESIGTVRNCYITGTVNSGVYSGGAGGFCLFNSGLIENCYSMCAVDSGPHAHSAGFCLKNYGGLIRNCYSTGTVSGVNGIAGFCYDNTSIPGIITSCYWDKETSGCATSDGGTGKTTALMKIQGTFGGWDFGAIWDILPGINDGYPYLDIICLPDIVTQNATYITMTTARLRGYVNNDNGYSCNVSFEYTNGNGTILTTDLQYGKITGDMPIADVIGLSANTTYQYRFKAGNLCGTSYGAWINFSTKATCVEPSELLGISVGNNVSLSWVTGSGSANTLVRYKFGSYPASPADGSIVCLTSGASYKHTGLRSGTTYYYSAWGEDGAGGYSANYISCMVTTFIGSGAATTPTAPATPSNWFLSPDYTHMQHFPFYGFINMLADTGHIPRNAFWMTGAIFITVVASMFVFKKSDNNLAAAVLFAAVLLSISSAMWLMPGLMAGMFLVFALGLSYKELVR